MLLSPSRVVCGVTARRNNWLKMRWRSGFDCCDLRHENGSGPNYLKAIIRNKSTEVEKESRLEIRDRSLFSSSLSQSSSIASQQTQSTSISSSNTASYRISEEIYEAIKNNSKPVVALESAIITHGMPYPDNIQTAMHLQIIIRQQGVIPATVGVIKGQLTVGLSDEEIETLGSSAKNGSAIGPSRTPVVKVSRRDLPYVLSQKLYGGTTVSGTIIAAVKANIPIFVTGGLGGVHRGAESTFDISADLKELGRSPIAVISAGVKSILDIGKTLEYLETEGVCVCVLKKTDQENSLDARKSGEEDGKVKDMGVLRMKFPSFFTQESPFTAPYSVGNEMEAAHLLHSSIQFGLQSGILIAVPIPKEFAASGERIDRAIGEALEKAEREGINGKDMTPFLLGIVNELTGGKSLEANKHLVENNARVGAQIALQLARLRNTNDTLTVENLTSGSHSNEDPLQHNSSSSSPSSHSHTHFPNDMNSNSARNDKDNDSLESGNVSKNTLDRKSGYSKSSLNFSRPSPTGTGSGAVTPKNPGNSRSISTSTSTATPTLMSSSTLLTSSHTSNPDIVSDRLHSRIGRSNIVNDHRNGSNLAKDAGLVTQDHPNGQFLTAALEQEPESTSKSKNAIAVKLRREKANAKGDIETETQKEKFGENRNGSGDVSISRKGSRPCVEVGETKIAGKKETTDHPFSSTTRPIVIGGTSLDLVLRIQEENIVFLKQ